MPRKVRTTLAKMGLPEAGKISGEKAASMATRYVAENLYANRNKPSHDLNEDLLVEMIDDKRMLAEILEEYLPIFKKIRSMRDPDEQLKALVKFAPMVLGRNLLFGDHSESRQAAKDILDRVQGRPIERQMTMNVNVNTLTETEVDNELSRLLTKFNPGSPQGPAGRRETDVVIPPEEERGDLGSDQGGSDGAESSPEALLGVQGEDQGLHSGEQGGQDVRGSDSDVESN